MKQDTEIEMARINQIVPDYLKSHFKPTSAEFITQDDLLSIPFVKTYRVKGEGGNVRDPYFHQYSLYGNVLMVETFSGSYSHEIGLINDISNLTLPKWNETK